MTTNQIDEIVEEFRALKYADDQKVLVDDALADWLRSKLTTLVEREKTASYIEGMKRGIKEMSQKIHDSLN